MPELDDRLWFDVIPWDRHLLVRLYVRAPFAEKPKILERLLDFLRCNNDVRAFKVAFPEDGKILLKLQRVLAGSTIRPERVSGVHWGGERREGSCHSVFVQI
jgi:hypothetical protein